MKTLIQTNTGKFCTKRTTTLWAILVATVATFVGIDSTITLAWLVIAGGSSAATLKKDY